MTGIVRSPAMAWYLRRGGVHCVARVHRRLRSAPAVSRTRYRPSRPPARNLTSGLDFTLWYQAGLCARPWFDAIRITSSPSVKYVSGATLGSPVLAPSVSRDTTGVIGNEVIRPPLQR